MYYLLNYMYIEKSTSLNFEIGVLEMWVYILFRYK